MPLYLVLAVTAYFFLALAGLIDKVLLKSVIISPRAYAFYVGLLGLVVLAALPFGLVTMPEIRILVTALASGAYGVYALWAFYTALKSHEASRVITTVGALTPVFTLLLSIVVLGEKLNAHQLAGFALLVLGGAVISYRENVEKTYTFELFGHAARAAMFFSASFVLLKFVFIFEDFVNGFFWTRLGGVIGSLTIILVPEGFHRVYWATKKAPKTAPIPFILNQVLGGAGAVLQNYAIFLGSAALVGAVQGVQYAFLLIAILLLSSRFPQIREQFGAREWVQKILAILIVGAGLYLISV